MNTIFAKAVAVFINQIFRNWPIFHRPILGIAFCVCAYGIPQPAALSAPEAKVYVLSVQPSPAKRPLDLKAKEAAKAELALGRAFSGKQMWIEARAHLEKALVLDPELLEAVPNLATATECLRNLRKPEIDLALTEIDMRISRGEFDKAIELSQRLQDKYKDGAAVASALTTGLAGRILSLKNPLTLPNYPWLASYYPWNGGTLLWQVILFFLIFVLAYLYLAARVGQFLRRKLPHPLWGRSRPIRWTVWSIVERETFKGNSGVVMDALKVSNNPLLREQFKPPSLLLVPPSPTATAETPVWRNFLSTRRELIGIERIPIERMMEHEFLLEEAFEDMDLKVGGIETKGLVGAIRNLRRWFYKGQPAANGAIFRTDGGDASDSWGVRLTCNRERNGRDKHEGLTSGAAISTISVFASTTVQDHGDALGLAAQRAAFKLFYRLAEPECSPTEVTAIAAFHQGVRMLLMII